MKRSPILGALFVSKQVVHRIFCSCLLREFDAYHGASFLHELLHLDDLDSRNKDCGKGDLTQDLLESAPFLFRMKIGALAAFGRLLGKPHIHTLFESW